VDELQSNARALLDAAREAADPSTEDMAAVAARLGISAPPPPPPPAANQAPGVWTRWLVAVGVTAAVAAAVVVAERREPKALDPAVVSLPDLALEPPHVPAATPVAVEPPAATDVPTPAPALTSPTPKKRRSPRPAATQPTANLGDELKLIVRARKALASGNDTAARSAARSYGRRFPEGSFVEEARVVELIASCRIERDPSMVRKARRYVDAHDSSFADRVSDACLAAK